MWTDAALKRCDELRMTRTDRAELQGWHTLQRLGADITVGDVNRFVGSTARPAAPAKHDRGCICDTCLTKRLARKGIRV